MFFIDRCSKNEGKVSKHLDAMLSSSDCVGLYVKVLELLRFDLETPEYRGLSTKVQHCLAYMPYLTLWDKISQNSAYLKANSQKNFQISQNF